MLRWPMLHSDWEKPPYCRAPSTTSESIRSGQSSSKPGRSLRPSLDDDHKSKFKGAVHKRRHATDGEG